MVRDTIVTHSFHGAGAMEKITLTLINRFQSNCRYHTSLTQSLLSSVNLKSLKLKKSRYDTNRKESVFLRNVNQTTN